MTSGIILSKGNGFGDPCQWSLGWPAQDGGIALRIENNFFGTGFGSAPIGRWGHIALVKRGASCQAYANGKPSGEPHDLSKLGPFVNDRPLRIGRREHEPNPAFFNGKLSRIVLLNCALDPDQIQAHAQGKAD